MTDWAGFVQSFLLVSGGGVGVKLLDLLTQRWSGSSERRRSEVDAALSRAVESRAREEESAKRARLAVEHAHELRAIMLRSGHWSSSELPTLNLRG